MLLHRLDCGRSRAKCIRLNSYRCISDLHVYIDEHAYHSDSQCHSANCNNHRLGYADCYADSDQYINQYNYADAICACHVDSFRDIDTLVDAIVDSFAHAFMDAKHYQYTNDHRDVDRYSDCHDHSIPINDRTPSISEVTDLCFRSFGF